MRFFQQLASNIVTMPVLHAISRNPQWWDADKRRTTFEGTPHGSVSDIILRFGTDNENVGDDLEAVDRPVMKMLPDAKRMSLDVMRMVGGSRLGRLVITKLPPGKSILPHADVMGAYAEYYTRYHLALLGLPGSLFRCGDETVNMQTGELWWFDAAAEHELRNNSDDDRIHLLIDVRIDP
jgi:hypothetical protein